MDIENCVMGEKITRTYSVKEERTFDGEALLKSRPVLRFEEESEWVWMLSFDYDCPRNNSSLPNWTALNIGADEQVLIVKEIFRADLNKMYLYSDKVVEIVDINKEESERTLKTLLREWNKQEIEKDKNLLAYCRVHKLDVEETDVDELRSLIAKINKKSDHVDAFQYTLYPQVNPISFYINDVIMSGSDHYGVPYQSKD